MLEYINREKIGVQRCVSWYNATLWTADEKRRTSRSLLDRLGRFFPRTDGSHRQLMIAFRVGRLRHTLFLSSIEIVYGQKWFIRYFYIVKVPSECNRTKSVCGVFWQAINSKLQTKEVCLRHHLDYLRRGRVGSSVVQVSYIKAQFITLVHTMLARGMSCNLHSSFRRRSSNMCDADNFLWSWALTQGGRLRRKKIGDWPWGSSD